MIKNYIKTALRSIRRNKIYALINILGLTLGLTIAIILFLTIQFDLGFDRFHPDRENIYRVVRHESDGADLRFRPNVPYPLAGTVRTDIPGLAGATGFHYAAREQVEVDGERFFAEDIIFADSSFFEIFGFNVLSGNPAVALGQPNMVFVTREFADTYLKGNPAVGRTIKLNGTLELEVAGILEDPPSNSHFNFSMLVSFPSFNDDFTGGFDPNHWGVVMSGYCYVRLPASLDRSAVEVGIQTMVEKFLDEDDINRQKYHLQPLSDIHFDSRYKRNGFKTIDEAYLVVITSIGLFILVIACINYINLSTALAIKKAKEVGIRKTLGAGRGQLVQQFMGETLLVVFSAGVMSLGLVEWLLPSYNDFFEKEVSLNLLGTPSHILLFVGVLVLVTLVSGFYPSWILSKYQPVRVLKSKFTTAPGKSISLRHGLVIFQFVITQVLIIGIIIISDQVKYFHSKPLGFEKEAIIIAPLFSQDSSELATLKQRLLSHEKIQHVSFGLGVPISGNNIGTTFRQAGDESSVESDITLKAADEDYLATFGLNLVAGRWMNESDRYARERSIIVNQTTTELMGHDDPREAVGKRLALDMGVSSRIIGVVDDFHTQALREKIKPMAILNELDLFFEAGIKISTENSQETIAFIEDTWDQVYPEHIFEYSFLDEDIQQLYREEERTLALMRLFAAISIFIGCLGLFGLISFVVFQKNKEVGIRKVLGANLSQLVYFLSKEFLALVVVAFLIASPLAWYLMTSWMQDFAYKITISPVSFLAALTATLIIVMITIGYRSVKAAFVNPVDVLKEE